MEGRKLLSIFKKRREKTRELPCSFDLAREIIWHIFTFADVRTLAKCRLVCRLWQSVVEDPLLWKRKTLMEGKKWPKIPVDPTLHWTFYAKIYKNQPFERNLIRNPCGADKLKNWSIVCEGGNRFAVECPPAGCDNLPDEVTNPPGFQNSCFATSYYICSKEQTIDLNLIGIPERVMNCYKPSILISEWYAARTDCGSVYESEVSLMDSKYTILAKYPFRATFAQWEGGAWRKMEKVIRDYPKGVQYIKFCHRGEDTQFWAGHYGSKFTAASIVIRIENGVVLEEQI